MPRAKHNPYAELRAIVALLSRLTHDELRDLADMLQADMAKTAEDLPLRKGLPPVNKILPGGWQFRETPPMYNSPARRELRDAYEAAYALKDDATWLIVDFARVLSDALAPVKDRKQHNHQTVARGSIEAKHIPRWVSVEDGPPEQRLYGPYLYYRYWATGGDADKRKKRQKNQYIGAPSLAVLYLETDPGSTERRELEALIIAAHKAGTIEALTKELVLEDKPPDVFMADYQPEPNRRAYHETFNLTDVQREVLATIAAGQQYGADYKEGLAKRKMARRLAELDLLREVTGHINHRLHTWRLTEHGLNIIRQDTGLQAMIAPKLDRD